MKSHRTRTARRKLSPIQFIKGTIIRVGLAKKVKVRNAVKAPEGPESKVQFQLIWHRLVILFVCLAFVGWISLATAAYFFVKYARNFPEVQFTDLVLPHRWDHYRVARGDYYIAQAQEKLEAGDTSGVIQLIRVGVHQSPNNVEGRLMLAQIYSMIGRPDLGIEVLRARAAEHADDIDYLRSLISLLFSNHEDTAVEELATRLLNGSTEPTDRNLVLAIAKATACFNRGNYDRAQQVIDDFELIKARSGTLLQARIDWEVGYSDLAIQRLETIMRNAGDQEEQVLTYLIDYLWKSDKHDRAQQVAFNRFVADPLAYAPRIRLLHIYAKRGDTAKESVEVETYIRLFGQDQEAMRALAEFAAQSRQPDLAGRVYEHSLTQGQDPEWPALALIEARVASGAHAAALRFYGTIEADIAEWTPLQQSRLQPLLAVAYLGAGDTERGDAILNEILVRDQTNPANLITLAQRLVELDDFSRGRGVLNHLHHKQPLNQEALTRLIQLDIQTGHNREIVQNIRRLLGMRKPSPTVLESAHRHISSDRFLFHANRAEILESLESALVSSQPRAS